MNAIFAYSLTVSVVLMIIYPVMHITVIRNRNFRFNRIMLIAGLASAFILPLVPAIVAATSAISSDGKISIEDITIGISHVPSETNGNRHSMIFLLIVSYYIGVVFMAVRTLVSIIGIYAMRRTCKKDYFMGHRMYIHHNENIAPFSFGNSIFVSENEATETILIHECGHINAGHRFDILAAEIACIFLWYNPFAWLYKNIIKLNHEFEADNAVISNGTNISEYQHLLINKALGRRSMPLGNSFATKSRYFRIRVLAMNSGKTPSARKLISALMIPGIALAMFLINNPVSAKALGLIKDYDFNESPQSTDLLATSSAKPPVRNNSVKEEVTNSLESEVLPSPLEEQEALAEVIKYAIKTIPNNGGKPIKTNVSIVIDKEGKVIEVETDNEKNTELNVALKKAFTGIRFDINSKEKIAISVPVRIQE